LIIDAEKIENILNYEITTYSNIQNCILSKKEALIKGDIETLQKIDNEILIYEQEITKIEAERNNIKGSFQRMTLGEVVEKLQKIDKQQAERILEKKEKIKEISQNIKKYNEVNTELIKHAIKLVENSISSIIGAFVPETKSYNSYGKSSKNTANTMISSVIKNA